MTTSTIAHLHRTSQAYCIQLCEKETLDHGIAYYSKRYPAAAELNQFREMIVPDDATCVDAVEQAKQCFARQKMVCRRWAAAYDQPPEPWAPYLAAQGFAPRRFKAMNLAHWPDVASDPSIRVLPARAMRAALRETFLPSDAPANTTHLLDRANILSDRLDDSAFDLFVAVIAGAAAGRCALYQVGDVARVMELDVLPAYADSPIAEALLTTVLALARRLMMQTICIRIHSENSSQHALLGRFGFVDDGEFIEMELPAGYGGEGSGS